MMTAVHDPLQRFTQSRRTLLTYMQKNNIALMYQNCTGNAFYLCGDGRLMNRVGTKCYFTSSGAEDIAEAVRFFRMEPKLDLTEALHLAGLRIRQILEWPERHLIRLRAEAAN